MRQIRQLTGYCAQIDIIWKELNLLENVIIFGMMRGLKTEASKQEAIQLLDALDLLNYAHKSGEDLNHGQKRRLSVAMAVIGEPELIILDEPTTGMDAMSRRKIWQLLKEKKRDGRVILVSTNSAQEAKALSDRVVVVSGGRIVSSGSAEFLCNQSESGMTITLSLEEGTDFPQRFSMVEAKIAGIIPEARIALSNVHEIGVGIDRKDSDEVLAVLEAVEEVGFKDMIGLEKLKLSSRGFEQVINDWKSDGSRLVNDNEFLNPVAIPQNFRRATPSRIHQSQIL